MTSEDLLATVKTVVLPMSLLTAAFIAAAFYSLTKSGAASRRQQTLFMLLSLGWALNALYLIMEIGAAAPAMQTVLAEHPIAGGYSIITTNMLSSTAFMLGSLLYLLWPRRTLAAITSLAWGFLPLLFTVAIDLRGEREGLALLPSVVATSVALLLVILALEKLTRFELASFPIARSLILVPLAIYAGAQFLYLYASTLSERRRLMMLLVVFLVGFLIKIAHLAGVGMLRSLRFRAAALRELDERVEQDRLREQARQLERQKNQIAEMIHEIKTPTAELRILLNELESDLLSRQNVRGRVARVQSSLVMLLSTLTAAHRIIEGRFHIDEGAGIDDLVEIQEELVPYNLNTAVQAAILAVKSRMRDEGRQLKVKIETTYTSKATIECQPSLVIRLFINLLRNAYDAIEGRGENWSGRIVIKTHRYAGEVDPVVDVSVADNGEGIPEEARGHLFRRRFSTRKGEGRGYGLYVAKAIVDKHGGAIEVESGDLGRLSTRFTVTLPDAGRAVGNQEEVA